MKTGKPVNITGSKFRRCAADRRLIAILPRRIFAGCIALLLTAALFTCDAGAEEVLLEDEVSSGGLLAVPGENDIESTVDEEEIRGYFGSDSVPAKYVTPMLPDLRKQFYATCWAHASIALTEISLMKKGIIDKPDLSELHTVWFSYNSVTDPLGGTSGDSNGLPRGSDLMNTGGNPVFAQNVLAGWTGAADEELLNSADASSVRSGSLLPSGELAYEDVAHLSNFYEVNLKEDPEGAKRLIMDQGAIAVSYYSASTSSPTTSTDTYNAQTGAFYDKNTHGGRVNHAVVIVGWDDDYSVDNFPVKPDKKGAWLVRNSWMTGSSEEALENLSYAGYFWMSYENASLAAGARAFDADASTNYAHNYQYDGAMYRTGWNPGSSTENEMKAANVFTAGACDSGEYIRAGAFQTSSANLRYRMELYVDLTDETNPESGRLMRQATVTGTTKYPGYYTIPFAESVPVAGGQSFAVILTLTKSGGSPTLSREQDWNRWASISAGISEGQSFYYDDGWRDLALSGTPGGNLVIKAFTDDVPEGTQIILPDPDDDVYVIDPATRASAAWRTDQVKEADACTRAALAEDLSITGEAEDGSLSDAQVRDILYRMSGVGEDGIRVNKLWIAGIDDTEGAYVYTGEAVKPRIHIYDGVRLLRERRDYVISHAYNKNAGRAALTVRFTGNYGSGRKTFYYEIAPALLGRDVVADEMALAPRKGNALQRPVPTLRMADTGRAVTVKSSDFKITYSPAGEEDTILTGVTSPGEYVAHIIAKDRKQQNYRGELDVPILVTADKTPVSRLSVYAEKTSYVYTGSAVIPKIVVTDPLRNDTLREGTDYISEVMNNVEPGRAVMIIKGTGSHYVGMTSVGITIKGGKKAVESPDGIRIDHKLTVPYVKGGAMPEVTVRDGDAYLTQGVDYNVSYSGNKKVTDRAVIRIRFCGRYSGTIIRYFKIRENELSKLRDDPASSDTSLTDIKKLKTAGRLPVMYYAGENVVLADGALEGLMIDVRGEPLIPGEDFEVVGYLNNDRRGTGQVILRGISREDGTGYTGLRTLTFTIRPRRTENIERY